MKYIMLLVLAACATAVALGQAVVTIPAINPNYSPNRSEKPIIPLLPQTSSKMPIDPNDYIGVDISGMSSSQRAKIESAFRKHTGEGFTGSKYDPNSPTFAYGAKKPAQSDKEEGLTAERLSEIKAVIDICNSKQISEATALKFLEVLGVSRDEATKMLQ